MPERAQATQPNAGQPTSKQRKQAHTTTTLLSGNFATTSCCYYKHQHITNFSCSNLNSSLVSAVNASFTFVKVCVAEVLCPALIRFFVRPSAICVLSGRALSAEWVTSSIWLEGPCNRLQLIIESTLFNV